ncbi:MAG: hypothetical protein MUC49_15580 [Raineya sp.]|nr:hypothetical protein [Raineya sp.]
MKVKKKNTKSQVIRLGLLAELEAYLKAKYGIYAKEYTFHPTRQWRFDYAIPNELVKIAIEIEGGIYSGGRHTRGSGYQKDLYKYNTAVKMGWRLYRFTYSDLKKKIHLKFI